MENFNLKDLDRLFKPEPDSHKGQNGKLLLIGGSHLFHAASLWALRVASRIVDMVFYASVPENNQIVLEAKKEFQDGIVVPRADIESYINEADVVLIGPGLLRTQERIKDLRLKINDLREIDEIKDEGEQTYYLMKYLLEKYPQKKWVIDAGALQMMEPEWLKELSGTVIITPHQGEFETLKLKVKSEKLKISMQNLKLEEQIKLFAKEFGCVVLLKGKEDIVCGSFDSAQGEIRCERISGGNSGMTKGGTGDVLAGLVAALACKNDMFLAASAGSYLNKKAGDELFKRVGHNFNSSDLAEELPRMMRDLYAKFS